MLLLSCCYDVYLMMYGYHIDLFIIIVAIRVPTGPEDGSFAVLFAILSATLSAILSFGCSCCGPQSNYADIV